MVNLIHAVNWSCSTKRSKNRKDKSRISEKGHIAIIDNWRWYCNHSWKRIMHVCIEIKREKEKKSERDIEGVRDRQNGAGVIKRETRRGRSWGRWERHINRPCIKNIVRK